MIKPTTHQRDLAKLPRALAPLIEQPQWAVWKWTQRPDGSWQKPPFQARDPQRHASTSDPATWADYHAALAAVQAGHAEGISYVLTADDPFGAFDLDHCRCTITNSIDIWAQNFLEFGRSTYTEVTPSGSGCRIWGLADGVALNRKFKLKIDDKDIAVELFRRTNKVLTITGYRLDTVPTLTNIDELFDWAVIWAERRKAAAAVAAPAYTNGNGFDSSGCGYSIDEIEQIVRTGPPEGTNRSDVFHTIVGHYSGCGWDVKRIVEHLQQFPEGIGGRYLVENRLAGEVARSFHKFAKAELPLSGNSWTDNWETEAPQPEQVHPELEPDVDPELGDQEDDPELDDDDDLGEAPQQDLPPLYAHGDPDPRLLKSWLVKRLMSTVGHGLLSGQWGAGKTFVVFDLFASLITGQPFLGHQVKRQCGVLLIAAEGADEIRLRLDAVVREKCGGMARAPIRWYETAPTLLQKGAAEKLIAMARQADKELRAEFGLPLGFIAIDTVTASAGYAQQGAENDSGVGQAIMNVLKAVAQAIGCFVLGVDHLGKDVERGTRGAGSKEGSGDVVWYCLGERELSGSVKNTRLAIRKNRGGKQGQQCPFVLREVAAPELDEDGEPITTMVVDWQVGAAAEAPAPPDDPWAAPRRQDQRTAVLRLKRVLMAELAEQGVDLPIPPDGLVVRMIAQEIVRKCFYARTPADEGTPEQKGEFRRKRFSRAVDWAEDQQLIDVLEINGVTYLRLARVEEEPD